MKRLLQFSLRTMVVLVMLSAFAFAGFYYEYTEARDRSAAVEHLRDFPGFVRLGSDDKQRGPVRAAVEEPNWMRGWLTEQLGVDFNNDANLICLDGRKTFSDDDFAMVCRLTHLKSLRLGRTEISDEGLRPIWKLRNLESLSLSSSQLTDDGLASIAMLPKLHTLTLFQVPIGDEGIRHLESLSTLELIRLRETNVTEVGVDRLQAALPDCVIRVD